jgi:site-specific DNA recombinase
VNSTRWSRAADLASDGTVPTAKIRIKPNEINIDRACVEAKLSATSDQLAVGAGVLRDAPHVVANRHRPYRDGNAKCHGTLTTSFQNLYIDGREVAKDELVPLFAVLSATRKQSWARNHLEINNTGEPGVPMEPKAGPPGVVAVFVVDGSSRAGLVELRVELRGFEPLTYSMRTSRATNCAIAPGR